MRRTTITLPDDLASLLTAEAERLRTSVSDVVRRFIIQGFTRAPGGDREIAFAGIFHDPDMTAATDLEAALPSWADDQDRDRG